MISETRTHSLLCIEEDLCVVELVILSVLDGVVRHSGIHLRRIANEPWERKEEEEEVECREEREE